MRVGVDIDGCERDIYTKLVQVYKREFDCSGDEYWVDPIEKWNSYNISDRFSIGDEIYPFWFNAHAEEIYKHALPYSGVGLFRSLAISGYDIIALTDQPNPATTRYTVEWIHEYLPVKEIHITPNKHLVECDIYLDDAPHHLKNFKDHDLNYVIMTRPWNINEPDLNGAVRVKNLFEFEELILKDKK